MDSFLGYGRMIARILRHFKVNLFREIGQTLINNHLLLRNWAKFLTCSKEIEILTSINSKVIRSENYNTKIHYMNRKGAMRTFLSKQCKEYEEIKEKERTKANIPKPSV